MVNYLNLFAGVVLFIVSSAVTYGLWTPTMNLLNYFPTALYIFCAVAYVIVIFTAIFYLPLMHLISDDRGY